MRNQTLVVLYNYYYCYYYRCTGFGREINDPYSANPTRRPWRKRIVATPLHKSNRLREVFLFICHGSRKEAYTRDASIVYYIYIYTCASGSRSNVTTRVIQTAKERFSKHTAPKPQCRQLKNSSQTYVM